MGPELVAGLVAISVAVVVLSRKMLDILQDVIKSKRNGGKAKGSQTIILEHTERLEREEAMDILRRMDKRSEDLHEWFGPDGPYAKLHKEIADD